jgi:pyridoxal/pyridoxine/pyridoxamine kinase
MASFVMQSLGCDVSAINTVHYSTPTTIHISFLLFRNPS